MTGITLWVLFSLATGHPVQSPNSFATQGACIAASAVYQRLAKHGEQYRCEPFRGVIVDRSHRAYRRD